MVIACFSLSPPCLHFQVDMNEYLAQICATGQEEHAVFLLERLGAKINAPGESPAVRVLLPITSSSVLGVTSLLAYLSSSRPHLPLRRLERELSAQPRPRARAPQAAGHAAALRGGRPPAGRLQRLVPQQRKFQSSETYLQGGVRGRLARGGYSGRVHLCHSLTYHDVCAPFVYERYRYRPSSCACRRHFGWHATRRSRASTPRPSSTLPSSCR